MKRINRTRFIIGFLISLVIVIALATSQQEGNDTTPPTHLKDATPNGGRALALVMEHLGYTAQAQYAPINRMPADARLWFLLDSKTTFSDREADSLLAWVRGGGTLFWVASREESSLFGVGGKRPGIDRLRQEFGISNAGGATFDANGLPKMTPLNFDSVANYRVGVKGASSSGTTLSLTKPALTIATSPGGTIDRVDMGKGRVFLFADAWTFCNYGISHDDNATFLANLVRVHNLDSKGGKAYFDERQHDNTLAPPTPDDWPARLRQKPVVYAVWQLLIVGLGTLALVSRRLGSPVPLPTQAPVTRASGFARAMGGLLFKAGRPKAAAQIIGESFRVRLARRIGLSPRESDEVLAARASEISSVPREVLSRALMTSRAPAANESSALRDAQEMERILEQLG